MGGAGARIAGWETTQLGGDGRGGGDVVWFGCEWEWK